MIQPSDADYGNGMTLLSKTGNNIAPTAASADLGSGVEMSVQPNAAALASEFIPPFSPGRVRINRGTFAKIEGVQGPYTISINFQSANGTAVDRYPVVKIGGTSYNVGGSLMASDGNTACQLKVNYNGTDSPLIYLKLNGGGRVWDVHIEGLREK